MIVDCHTHWGQVWQNRDPGDPSKWLAILDRHGIDCAIVLPEKGMQHAGLIREDHDEMATVCAKSSGRMLPFATANIWFAEEALAELRRCLGELQFRGMKFHPWVQGASTSCPAMDSACELAAEYDVPILFHDGTPPYSLPSQIGLLARRHPNTQIVLGHSGLFEHWREVVAALNGCANLWACLCGPNIAGLRGMIQRCNLAQLLWGTDQGYSLADCYDYRLPLMDQLHLDDKTRHAIFETNPTRLLEL